MTWETLARLDHEHLWHPFTEQSAWTSEPPLIIAAAEGCELIDSEGRRYLDGVGSLWVGVHGHRHPAVDAAIRQQLEAVAHTTLLGLSHPPAIRLARLLAELSPTGLERVFYSDSGSTAVEIALKMAFQWQQQQGRGRRRRFAALSNAYHGDTLGAVSVGGIDLFHAVYGPLLFDCVRLEAPRCRDREQALAAAAVETLRTHGEELAAVIVEPLVQGAAGMLMHSPAFLRPVLEAAREVGALVIADEVATGLGRTGTMFAMEQVGLSPDLLCLGKGLTNGYLPVAATLTTERVYRGFVGDRGRTFFHGHTFTGNPLGCAAAVACLETFDAEDTLGHVARRSDQLRTRLAPLPDRCASVWEVRQQGLMVGIELRGPDGTPLDPAQLTGQAVCLAARRHGAVLRPLGDVVVLMPPLAISSAQLDRLVDIVAAAIGEVGAG